MNVTPRFYNPSKRRNKAENSAGETKKANHDSLSERGHPDFLRSFCHLFAFPGRSGARSPGCPAAGSGALPVPAYFGTFADGLEENHIELTILNQPYLKKYEFRQKTIYQESDRRCRRYGRGWFSHGNECQELWPHHGCQRSIIHWDCGPGPKRPGLRSIELWQ